MPYYNLAEGAQGVISVASRRAHWSLARSHNYMCISACSYAADKTFPDMHTVGLRRAFSR